MFKKITSSFIQFGGAGRSRGFLDGAGKVLKFDLGAGVDILGRLLFWQVKNETI